MTFLARLRSGLARSSGRIARNIAPTRKAFNPAIGRIKTERILILQKD